MDDRRFDELSRRIGALALPRLPRRGVMGLLGGATLAGVLGVGMTPRPVEAAKCKKEGQKCNKKKCKQKNKKCCCEGKCRKDRCKGGDGNCPTDPSFALERESFTSPVGPDNFSVPWGIATDPDGNVYVTDADNFRVVAFNQNLNYRDEFGDQGTGPDEFEEPLGIGYNENNSGSERFLFVTDHFQNANDRMFRQFDGNIDDDNDFGDFIDDDGVAGLDDPFGIAVDGEDRVWVVNQSTPGTIFRFSRTGGSPVDFEPSFDSPNGDDNLQDPEGIAVFQDGGDTFIFVADTENNRIVKFEHVNDTEDGLAYRGEVGRANGASGTGNREFNRPTGLAVDDCGNVWVADRVNDRIAVFDKNLNFIDNFDSDLNGTDFNRPTGVALGPDDESLYVVDSENNRVVKFNLS